MATQHHAKHLASWSKNEKARRRDEAVEAEFDHYFGTDYHNVVKWQELCALVGLETEGLSSITKCKKVCIFSTLMNYSLTVYRRSAHARSWSTSSI